MNQYINDFSYALIVWQLVMAVFWIAVIIALVKLYMLLIKYLKLRINQLENNRNE